MGMVLKLCVRCKDILSEAYAVEPVNMNRYSTGKKSKQRCDFCRKDFKDEALVCCEVGAALRRSKEVS